MKEEMRTFGYLCPQCGKTVMGTRSVFALEASNAEVECACGKSALKVEFDGTEYHIHVPRAMWRRNRGGSHIRKRHAAR